eukprot:12743183-Heterocapsa_arctica.AAC.1
MRVIIDTQPAEAINGEEQKPVDRELFNQLIRRCREVNNELHVLQNQLSESEGFQFREQDLQNKIHRQQEMVEDLQRQVSSFEDLADSQARHIPELPVVVVNPE